MAGMSPKAVKSELGAVGRTHLHISNASPRFTGRFLVQLRARRRGFLRQAAATCLLSVMMLVGGRLRLAELASHLDAVAALLLLVPGALATYAVRSDEHELVSSLLIGVRLLVGLSAFCAVAGGALLLADLPVSTLEFLWMWLTLVAGCCLLVVLVSNLLPFAPSSSDSR